MKTARARKLLREAQQGEAIFIPLGLPKFGRTVDIAPAQYYLLGGDSGTGKTGIIHQLFVLDPYEWWLKNKDETGIDLRIYVRSMERPMEFTHIKWACRRLYYKYGFLIDIRTAMGRKGRIPDEIYEKLHECLDWVEASSDVIDVIPGTINPTGLWHHMNKVANEYGEIVDHGLYKEYVPNNKKQIILWVIDHLGLVDHESGLGDKGTLDRTSKYIVKGRDFFRMSSVASCQFNRGLGDIGRRNSTDLTPEKNDFKGSGNMYQDCDVCMALFDPFGEYGLKEWKGFLTTKMIDEEKKNRFRGLSLLKSTYDTTNVHAGLRFIGETGTFSELKSARDMTPNDYAEAREIQKNHIEYSETLDNNLFNG